MNFSRVERAQVVQVHRSEDVLLRNLIVTNVMNDGTRIMIELPRN